jgi:N-acetylmuramoyl-L-alanine amidase
LKIHSHPSPNFNERPDGTRIDTVVVHATVFETAHDVIKHFANPEMSVSAHYTIDRDGTVISHVPEESRAWHAGESRMKDGRVNVNDFSIGIELVNRNDGTDPFPEPQLASLRELLRAIQTRHPIRSIIPHYECAYPPGRKSDPVGFDEAWFSGIL